jgi:hypothetical protein
MSLIINDKNIMNSTNPARMYNIPKIKANTPFILYKKLGISLNIKPMTPINVKPREASANNTLIAIVSLGIHKVTIRQIQTKNRTE